MSSRSRPGVGGWLAALPALWTSALLGYALIGDVFPERAAAAYPVLLDAGRWLFWLTAGALLWPRLRAQAATRVEDFGALPVRRQAVWLTAASAALAVHYFFLKYCQYRGFQLPMDSAMTANIAAQFACCGRFESTVYGVGNYFSVHFQPLIALLSPWVALGAGMPVLLALQCAAVAAAPAAGYWLAYDRTRSAAAGLVLFALIATSPFQSEILANNLEASVPLAALFLWGMRFAGIGRWRPAAVLLALAACCSEQVQLAFFGCGLFWAWSRRGDGRRGWLPGAVISAAAAAVFAAEMALVASFPAAERLRSWGEAYGHLGATPAAALTAALMHPWDTAASLAESSRFAALLRVLVSTALLPLAAPATAWVWGINLMPQLLAPAGSHFNSLALHSAAQAVGPFWWAAGMGLAAHWRRLARSRWTPAFGALLLAACGWNLGQASPLLLRGWFPSYYDQAPPMLARIPREASVWATEFLTAPLGPRPYLKALPYDPDAAFTRRLFLPDYILFSKHWVIGCRPRLRRRVVRVILEEGYRKEAESEFIVLLKHPGAPLRGPAGRPPTLTLPEPDPDKDFSVRIPRAYLERFERIIEKIRER